ncbi:MAG: chromosomal replication initiator DnaA [Sphingopyxis sp.]|nr:chromosomal replication initiator DnaA [Sphingopyxis sp.]
MTAPRPIAPPPSVSSANIERDLLGAPVVRRAAVRQLALPLGWHAETGGAQREFLVSACNREAARHIENYPVWTAPATILRGPARSGKSTLAATFADKSGGVVVDTLSDWDEEAVFHAWNAASVSHKPLLIIADAATVDSIALPDLRTRLASAPVVTIAAPDACLAAALIDAGIVERRLPVPPRLGDYVSERVERSYTAIESAVEAIASLALTSARPVSIKLARSALIDAGLFAPRGDF